MHTKKMKTRWHLAAGIAFPLLAAAAGPQLDSLDPDQLHLVGSQCAFENKAGQTMLASDWIGKFWVKVDGKMVEFVTRQPDDEMQRQSEQKRWHDVLQAGELTLTLDLRKTGAHDDTASYQGRIELKRGGAVTRMAVAGGCTA